MRQHVCTFRARALQLLLSPPIAETALHVILATAVLHVALMAHVYAKVMLEERIRAADTQVRAATTRPLDAERLRLRERFGRRDACEPMDAPRRRVSRGLLRTGADLRVTKLISREGRLRCCSESES